MSIQVNVACTVLLSTLLFPVLPAADSYLLHLPVGSVLVSPPGLSDVSG